MAIKDAEEGLLNLKRSRLLREADMIFSGQEAGLADVDVKTESLDSREDKPEPLEPETYSLGSKWRFRHMDGRWYNGQIVGLEGAKSARISFLNPRSENMMVCTTSFLFIFLCYATLIFLVFHLWSRLNSLPDFA